MKKLVIQILSSAWTTAGYKMSESAAGVGLSHKIHFFQQYIYVKNAVAIWMTKTEISGQTVAKHWKDKANQHSSSGPQKTDFSDFTWSLALSRTTWHCKKKNTSLAIVTVLCFDFTGNQWSTKLVTLRCQARYSWTGTMLEFLLCGTSAFPHRHCLEGSSQQHIPSWY